MEGWSIVEMEPVQVCGGVEHSGDGASAGVCVEGWSIVEVEPVQVCGGVEHSGGGASAGVCVWRGGA